MAGDSKAQVRGRVRAARAARSAAVRAEAATLLAAQVVALPEVVSARTVAAYASTRTEPGTGSLREALRDRGVRVLLPVLCADDDLDWALDDGPVRPGRRPQVVEPAGQRLGPAALGTADVVVCPAVAVARDGTRLGQGGGSYDRALQRCTGLVVALVYDDELVDVLPRATHDRPVAVVVTPTRTVRISPADPAPET